MGAFSLIVVINLLNRLSLDFLFVKMTVSESCIVSLSLTPESVMYLTRNAIVYSIVEKNDETNRLSIGELKLSLDPEPAWNEVVNLKRPLVCKSDVNSSTSKPKIAKTSRPLKAVPSHVVPGKNVGEILQNLNILPEIPNDLQCALCPYKATAKSSLKTHYQLKHLGGVGLSVSCTICQQSFSMKKSAKRHMMSVHSLSSENVDKLLN